jgi:3-oxoacyl-[acyl-carrier protein] reductase
MADPIRHAGRVALVTGAGSPEGIGFAAAMLLGRGGASVAVTSTTERIHERAAELAAEGVNAAGFVADLTDHGQALELAAEVAVRLGPVDILVNNAGIAQVGEQSARVPFVELTEQQWDRDIAVNLKTAFNATRAVLPGMVERGWGRVVSVSSVTGPVVSYPGSAGYSAAKGAMDGLTRALAIETGPHAVTVNSVAPGWIETGSSDDVEREGGRNTPVGRSGTPFEVAELIAFLASDGARYLTGRSIVVDGGNTIQEFKGG